MWRFSMGLPYIHYNMRGRNLGGVQFRGWEGRPPNWQIFQLYGMRFVLQISCIILINSPFLSVNGDTDRSSSTKVPPMVSTFRSNSIGCGASLRWKRLFIAERCVSITQVRILHYMKTTPTHPPPVYMNTLRLIQKIAKLHGHQAWGMGSKLEW